MKKILIITILGILLISFASAGIIGDIMDWLLGKDVDEVFTELGISGMKIDNFKINNQEITKLIDTKDNIELETTYQDKGGGVIKQDIWIRNQLNEQRNVEVLMTIEINYNKIRWNGKEYTLKSSPVILNSWTEEGRLIVPNIFMDDVFNKRINYRDIAEKGGYATAYESGGKYYIDFVIDSLSLKPNEEYYIDPIFTNSSLGFDISFTGSATPQGLATDGTDYWFGDSTDDWIYHIDSNGLNATDGFDLAPLGITNVWRLTMNTSSLWILDSVTDGVNSVALDGTNITGAGFFTADVGAGSVNAITSNSTNLFFADNSDIFIYSIINKVNQTNGFTLIPDVGNPSAMTQVDDGTFYVYDLDSGFVSHFDTDGTNITDGFDASIFGIGAVGGMTTDGISLMILDTADLFVYYLFTSALKVEVFLDSPANNTLEIKGATIIFNATIEPTNGTLTNSSLFIYNSTTDLVNRTTNSMDATSNVTSYSVSDLIAGSYLWNIEGCISNGTTSICASNSSDRTLNINNFEVVGEAWLNETYETQNETFRLNITVLSSIASLSASLNYNGTRYTSTDSCVGTTCAISSKIDIPIIKETGINSHNKTFFWEVTLFDGVSSTTLIQNTTIQQQNVTKINFSSCGTGATIVNFTTHNETDRSLMDIDSFEAGFEFYLGTGSVKKNYSYNSGINSSFDFCMSPTQPNNLTMKVSSRIELEKDGFTTRLYDFIGIPYINSTITQQLFLLNSSSTTTIIIEVKDQGLSPLPNIIVNISKYYPDINAFIQVERRRTDAFGTFVAKLIENDETYMFEFFDLDGNLLKTIPNLVVACRSTYCVIPIVIEIEVSAFDDFETLTSYSSDLSFSNMTNIFIFSWDDKRNEDAITRLEVKRFLLNGSAIICNDTSTSQLSILTCDVGDLRASYSAQAFRTATIGSNAGREVRISVLDAKVGEIFSTFGKEGLLWVFLLLFTGLGIGAFNPSVGAAIYGMGFIAFGIIGIISMPISIFFANTVIVIIFIWAVRS